MKQIFAPLSGLNEVEISSAVEMTTKYAKQLMEQTLLIRKTDKKYNATLAADNKP